MQLASHVAIAKYFDAIASCLHQALRAYSVRGIGPAWAATTSRDRPFSAGPANLPFGGIESC